MVPVWIRPWLLAALLCYSVFGFYWYLMAGYAHSWQRGPSQTLEVKLAEPLDWHSLEAAAAGPDTLLTLNSNGRDAEAESCASKGECRRQCRAAGQVTAGAAQPVLNCLVAPPKPDDNNRQRQIARLMRQSHPLGLTYLLRSDGDNVAVIARLQGKIEAMGCGSAGRCYLVTELPNMSDKTVFVSGDFGHHWRIAAQEVLAKAHVPKIVAVDGDQVWVDGYKRLYVSEDGGHSWRVLIDAERLMRYAPELLSGSLYTDTMTDFFDWYSDDSGRLYAVTGGRYQRAPDMVIYQVDARSGEILTASKHDGAFSGFENGPDGQLFGIFESKQPERYTLYRLHRGDWQPLKASGDDPMQSLRGSSRLLMLSRSRGDGRHLAVSHDGGQHWRAMDDIRFSKRMLFDPSGAGILRFGYRNRQGYYSYRWLRPE